MKHCCIDGAPPVYPARPRSWRRGRLAIATVLTSGWVAITGWVTVAGWDACRASQIAWTQDDWTQRAYEWQTSTDPDIHPGLLVPLNNPADPRFVAEPTDYRGLWALAVYHDSLFMGGGPYPLNPDGAEVLSYDYLTNQFDLCFEPPEEGIAVMKVRGDTMYVPGPDTHYSIPNGSSVYLYNGEQWTTKQHVVGALHLFDVEVMNDAIYVSSGDGTGNASVYQSLDHGDSFTRILSLNYSPEHMVRRMHGLGVHNGLLYAQPDGWDPEDDMVFTFDGTDWDTIAVVGLPQGNPGDYNGWQGVFTAWGDSLLLTVKDRLFIFANSHVYRSNLPFLCARMGSGFGIYKGAVYGGAASGHLYRWQPGQGWTQVCPLGLDPSTEPIQGFATYYGRLYIATSRTEGLTGGRLYVSACATLGQLVSLPHDFGLPVYDTQIAWDDFSPGPGAEVRFQVRSATSLSQLHTQMWSGPDGTPASWYTQSGSILPELHDGDQFFQYRVELLSPDGFLMPLLRSVTLSVDSIPGASVDEPLPAEPTAGMRLQLDPLCPNPAVASVLVRARINTPGLSGAPLDVHVLDVQGREVHVLDVHVLDVQGREVRGIALDLDAQRAAAWRWDLRDTRGRRVPTGVYQIAASVRGQTARPARGRVLVLP
jgi:hypothetical protein